MIAALLIAQAWTCLPGIGAPMRVRDGNVECASKNARDCMWGACAKSSEPQKWDDKPGLQPLMCGDGHRVMFGTDGYSKPGHWCAKACAGLQGCTAMPFTCLPGIGAPVRLR